MGCVFGCVMDLQDVLLRQTRTNFGATSKYNDRNRKCLPLCTITMDQLAAEGAISIKLHAHTHLQFIQMYTKAASLSNPSSDCGKI